MNRRTAGTLVPDSMKRRNFLCVCSSVGDFVSLEEKTLKLIPFLL